MGGQHRPEDRPCAAAPAPSSPPWPSPPAPARSPRAAAGPTAATPATRPATSPPPSPARTPPRSPRAEPDPAAGPSLTSPAVLRAAPPEPNDAAYLPGTVAWAAERFGDRPALVDPDGTALTYAALHARSDEVAAGLQRLGLGPGDVVALTLPSVAAWVVAYAAVAKAG